MHLKRGDLSSSAFLNRQLDGERQWRRVSQSLCEHIVASRPDLGAHTIWVGPSEVLVLLDLIGALARLYTGRNRLLFVGPPVGGLEIVIQRLMADGYQVDEARGPDAPVGGADVLAAVSLVSDPWLGTVCISDEIRSKLDSARIPNLIIEANPGRWSSSLLGGADLRPHEARVLSLSQAVGVVAGTRFRVQPLLAPWSSFMFQDEPFSDWIHPDFGLVQGFEMDRGVEDGYQPLLSESDPRQRLGDRALVYSTQFDGLAMVQALEEVGVGKGSVSCLSPLSGRDLREHERLRSRGLSSEQIRGAVIVWVEALRKPDWTDHWIAAFRRVSTLQQSLS